MSPRGLGAAAIGAVLAMVAGGCQGQPDLLCDSVRVVWPYFDIDPTIDVSDEPGLQIELVLRTGFLPGTVVALTVENEDREAVFEAAIEAEDDGTLRYPVVGLPEGPVSFVLEAANECGEYRTSTSAFVWDGEGYPSCSMNLVGVEPLMRDAFVDPVLAAAADADAAEPGFQGVIEVEAGRPDMEVTLFVLDLETGVESAQEQITGDDDRARFDVDLGDGHAAIRAMCLWPPHERRISSTTRRFIVDTVAPSCALAEPTAAVAPEDDLDGDPENGIQFELFGTSPDDDLAPSSARFTVDGAELEGGEIADGESRTEASYPGPDTPATQSFGFAVEDLAGNACSDSVTFER